LSNRELHLMCNGGDDAIDDGRDRRGD